MYYTLKDHQGSLTAIVCGNAVERLSISTMRVTSFSLFISRQTFFSVKIINKIANRISATPMATLSVKASRKTSVPMTMAVKGSRMPKMEVLVAPTALLEAAKVMVATAVGRMANPKIFSQLTASGTGLRFRPKPDKANNMTEPIRKQ